MATISKEQYPALKNFFEAWCAAFPFPGLQPEHSPLVMLESSEKRSPAMARRGLGMAVGDIVEMSWDLSREEVTSIDSSFSARGVLTLSHVRAMYSKKVWRIVERGKLRNEDEYYLVRSVSDYPELFPDGVTCEKIHRMLDEYGAK